MGRTDPSALPYTMDLVDCGGIFCGTVCRLDAQRSTYGVYRHWNSAGLRYCVCRSMDFTSPAAGFAARIQDPLGARGSHTRHLYLPVSDENPKGHNVAQAIGLAGNWVRDLLHVWHQEQPTQKEPIAIIAKIAIIAII